MWLACPMPNKLNSSSTSKDAAFEFDAAALPIMWLGHHKPNNLKSSSATSEDTCATKIMIGNLYCDWHAPCQIN